MCVGFWSLDHPDYALILFTNRDEFLTRPTEDAHFHAFGREIEDSVLSGLDIQGGGSWLGINREGRVAVLTNITEPAATYESTRGNLVSSFLLSDIPHPLEDGFGKIIPKDAKYAGFNLLLLAPLSDETGSLAYDGCRATNNGGGGPISARALHRDERHCGGISNGVESSGVDEWPKVVYGVRCLKDFLESTSPDVQEAELIDRLFSILSWKPDAQAQDRSHLRNTIEVDPIPTVPKSISSGSPEYYGTRLSTIILVRRDGSAVFIERDIWRMDKIGDVKKGDQKSERVFRFNLSTRTR